MKREPYTLQELRATVASVYQQWSTSRMPQPEKRKQMMSAALPMPLPKGYNIYSHANQNFYMLL